MRELDPGRTKRNIGLDHNGRVGTVPGDPEPKLRIGDFLPVVEQTDGNAERGEISSGNIDRPLGRVDSRDGIVETMAIEDGRPEFRTFAANP